MNLFAPQTMSATIIMYGGGGPRRPAPHSGLEAAPHLDPKAFSLRSDEFKHHR